jgi:hypothetical protein
MFVVIRRFPVKSFQDYIDDRVHVRMKSWSDKDKRRFLDPWYWLGVFTWRAPDLCSRWLVACVSNARRPVRLFKVVTACLAVGLVVGASALVLGTHGHTGRYYPLAGAFCQNMGLLCLVALVWMAVALSRKGKGEEQVGEVSLYFGRLIAWLISTALAGEIFWVLAYTNWFGNLFSYRLYTIWSVFEILTLLVIGGLLIDRWHLASDNLPVRQLALLGLVVFVWQFWRPVAVTSFDLERHLSPEQAKAWKTLSTSPQGPKPDSCIWQSMLNDKWLSHLNDRVATVPAGDPVVLVAASGGGSRAAIFAELVFETLARTPVDSNAPFSETKEGPGPHNWANNIVLISSVSGGSLATAQFVGSDKATGPPEQVATARDGQFSTLLNTSSAELQNWGKDYAAELIQAFLDNPPEAFPAAELDLPPDARLNPQVATKALRDKRKYLENQLADFSQQRDTAQTRLDSGARLSTNEKKSASDDLLQLSDKVSAVRTALALLDGLAALENPAEGKASWLWNSKAFDEMCVDFMAPIMRGAVTPALGRGDALAQFWTHRFHWYDCTNFSGYHVGVDKRWEGKGARPAVVFNAVNVARGSRLMVGFPPVPSDFFDAVYRRGVTREVPRPLNSPVSLARAVRMSSNFPYGFRAMSFTVPAIVQAVPATPAKDAVEEQPERVHVLDGGVLDNTGLDTIYELFAGLEYHAAHSHADPSHPNPYYDRAKTLLTALRHHGVCILEIDAGAKPDTALPAYLNPFGGVKEQGQALENSGYSNADRVKQFYLKEVRRILTDTLDDLEGIASKEVGLIADTKNRLPSTCLHYCFQCNHYKPGQQADPAIMTAWALGPRDKAEVVARFLPELQLWDQRRSLLLTDINASKKRIAAARSALTRPILVHQILRFAEQYAKLKSELQNLASRRETDAAPPKDDVAKVRSTFASAKSELEALTPHIDELGDVELNDAWKEMQAEVEADSDLLAKLGATPSLAGSRHRIPASASPPVPTPFSDGRSHGDQKRMEGQAATRASPGGSRYGAGRSASPGSSAAIEKKLESIGTRIKEKEIGNAAEVINDIKQGSFIDAQWKIDRANSQIKQVYEAKKAR